MGYGDAPKDFGNALKMCKLFPVVLASVELRHHEAA